MREREPWSLLKTRLPGVRYVVVSEDRRQDLLRLGEGTPRVDGESVWGDDPLSAGIRGPCESQGSSSSPGVPSASAPSSGPRRRHRRACAALLRLDDGWPFMLLPARITKRKNIEYAIGVTGRSATSGLRPRLLVTGAARPAQRPLRRLRRRAPG